VNIRGAKEYTALFYYQLLYEAEEIKYLPDATVKLLYYFMFLRNDYIKGCYK
jgi:hypothetical protein